MLQLNKKSITVQELLYFFTSLKSYIPSFLTECGLLEATPDWPFDTFLPASIIQLVWGEAPHLQDFWGVWPGEHAPWEWDPILLKTSILSTLTRDPHVVWDLQWICSNGQNLYVSRDFFCLGQWENLTQTTAASREKIEKMCWGLRPFYPESFSNGIHYRPRTCSCSSKLLSWLPFPSEQIFKASNISYEYSARWVLQLWVKRSRWL